MTLTKKSDGIYVDDSKIKILEKIDAVIFDCDGVLIDITKSYDLTIIKTTQYVLKHFAHIEDSIDVDSKIIDGFKATGGFNDEVDLTYAAIISIVAAKKLEKDQTNFIFDVINHSDSSGIVSVEKFIENLVEISDIKKQLSYPGTHHENPLYRIFDQIFYGPELYKKLFNNTSSFSESGLIERDDVILDDFLIEKLLKKFNSKIAMVTGRGKESVSYSLKSLLNKFDLNN
ncbi:MAG: phosphatase, partial [Nitrosopumilus sp.]|nr:phosphatase [Nitrosopumilus sp.]